MTNPRSEPGPPEPVELGKRLREAREYLGLSQEQVADYLRIPRPSVSTIEAGKRRISFLELKRLADLYRRPLSYFSGDEEPEVDETTNALFRTTQELSSADREQVLRFAQFLRTAGPAQAPSRKPSGR
jgi:transcriptional regulator with XRE-family HTH domain